MKRLVGLMLLLQAAACAHQTKMERSGPCEEPLPEAPTATAPQARPYQLVDGITGSILSDVDWAGRLRSARLIFVGEEHDNPAHHAFQMDVLSRVHAEDASVALALEMLPHTMQEDLSRFVAGQTDEAAFLAAVRWEQTWGFPFGLYAPLLHFARTHRLPAYALNAPRDVSRAVYKGGTKGLPPEQAQQLPEMLPGPAAHREFARQAFAGHGTTRFSDPKFEKFYEAQLLWDETMAAQLVERAQAAQAPTRVVVIAGEGHTRRFAVPLRTARRNVGPALLVLAVEADQVEAARASEAADVLAVFRDSSKNASASDAP